MGPETKLSILTPRIAIENSQGWKVSVAKFLEKYQAKLEIPGVGGRNQITILGGGINIFWNHNQNHTT